MLEAFLAWFRYDLLLQTYERDTDSSLKLAGWKVKNPYVKNKYVECQKN